MTARRATEIGRSCPKKKLKIRVVCSGRSLPHNGDIGVEKTWRKISGGRSCPTKKDFNVS